MHLIVGIDQNADIWILDLWRGQMSSDVWVEKMLDLGARWQPITWALEAGGILSAVMPLLQRRSAERRVYLPTQHFPSRFDKATRAQSFRGYAAVNGIHIPTRASWYAAFAQEWLTFPQGRSDDIIDCCALIGRMLPALLSGRRPKKDAIGWDPERDPYRPREAENNDSFKLL